MCTTFPGCLTATVLFRRRLRRDRASTAPRVLATWTRAVPSKTFATCAPAGSFARVGRFELDAAADLRLDYHAGAGERTRRRPVPRRRQPDVRSQPGRLPERDGRTHRDAFVLGAAGRQLLVDRPVGSEPAGTTTVTLSTGAITTPEMCNNGIDDDGNNFIDCADGACRGNPVCAGSECVPDRNIGTLVVNGPGSDRCRSTWPPRRTPTRRPARRVSRAVTSPSR